MSTTAPAKHISVYRFILATALLSLLWGCVNVDVGGPQADKDNPNAGTLTLADAKTYAILPSQFNYSGSGTYTYPDGRTLRGVFVNGLLTGRGTEATLNQRYEGQWENGVKQGQGRLERSDGSIYSGQFKDNLPHGKGEEQTRDGTYTGLFKAGKYAGEGQFKYGEHAYYQGQWVAGLRQGFGQYSHASGETYIGDWQHDQPQGFGRKKYADGSTYEGAWRGGQRQGYGTQRSARGVVYEGIWANDTKQGFGAQATPDGSRYEGEWLADKRHGSGKVTRLDSSYHEGTWSEDYILGPGVRRSPNGVQISGVWNQDFISHGLLTFPNGQEYAGALFKQGGKQVAAQLVTWLQQPDIQRDPHIQLFLASVYRDFTQPEVDHTLARLWLSRAAAAGLAQAQFELGVMQLNDDASNAVANFQAAAAQGHSGASQRLGEFHHVGLHVSKNPAKAIQLYETAVKQGSVVATNNLAWLLATVADESQADPDRAIKLIQPLVMYLGNWQHIDTFAAALARAGSFQRARRMQRIALERAAQATDEATLQQMQDRLQLYQASSAYLE